MSLFLSLCLILYGIFYFLGKMGIWAYDPRSLAILALILICIFIVPLKILLKRLGVNTMIFLDGDRFTIGPVCWSFLYLYFSLYASFSIFTKLGIWIYDSQINAILAFVFTFILIWPLRILLKKIRSNRPAAQ